MFFSGWNKVGPTGPIYGLKKRSADLFDFGLKIHRISYFNTVFELKSRKRDPPSDKLRERNVQKFDRDAFAEWIKPMK